MNAQPKEPTGGAGPGLREALSRNTAALVNAIVFLLAAFVIAGVLIVHGNGYGYVILVFAITYAALLASFLADSEKLLRRSLTALAIFLVVVAVVMAVAWQSYRHSLAAATYGIWAGAYVRYRVAYSRAARAPILIYTAHSLAAATLLLADYYWQLELSVAVPAILLSLMFYFPSRPQPRPKPRLKEPAANASVGQTTLDKAEEGGG